MASTIIRGIRIAGISTCVPSRRFDNIAETSEFTEEEVKKVVAMAGVNERRLADDSTCSSDLCTAAARRVLDSLEWDRNSIDALIMVTQSPDYLLPSTSCIIQKDLELSDNCAAFDVGLGCSGYPYGLWLAAMMLTSGGLRRALVLHGETPARFSDKSDRAVSLLFGDSGSATALEATGLDKCEEWFFKLHTDGIGYKDMIIEAGGFRNRFSDNPQKNFVKMNGASIFNFTIKRVPTLIQDTFALSKMTVENIDFFIFHQSNQFIIRHLLKKCGIPIEKVPMTLNKFGNTGGPSIPLTITKGGMNRPADKNIRMMLLGYGVGLSWGSAVVNIDPDVKIEHMELKQN